MFMNPSLVFDIICTVFWLVMALRYARKGMLASLVQIGGSLVGLIGAWRFAVWGSAAVSGAAPAGGRRGAVARSPPELLPAPRQPRQLRVWERSRVPAALCGFSRFSFYYDYY